MFLLLWSALYSFYCCLTKLDNDFHCVDRRIAEGRGKAHCSCPVLPFRLQTLTSIWKFTWHLFEYGYDSVLRNRLFRWRIAIFDRRNECWSQLHFITIVTVRHFPTNISARLPIVSVRPECTASYAPPDSHAVQHLNGRVIASLMAVWAECHVTSCNSVFQFSFWIDCVACSDPDRYTWYVITLHVHISRPGECVTWFMACVWRCE